MILYVDETENEDFFIVTGLLVNSDESIRLAYKKFKNGISGFKIGSKAKSKLFTEFKSTAMDRNYQRIKERMLKEVLETNCLIIYSCYKKNEPSMNQILKQSVYITLLSNILATLEDSTAVIFDGFGLDRFEKDIIRSADIYPSVINIRPGDSQKEPGLQFVDNLCSTIRRHISVNEKDLYYDYISEIVRVV